MTLRPIKRTWKSHNPTGPEFTTVKVELELNRTEFALLESLASESAQGFESVEGLLEAWLNDQVDEKLEDLLPDDERST